MVTAEKKAGKHVTIASGNTCDVGHATRGKTCQLWKARNGTRSKSKLLTDTFPITLALLGKKNDYKLSTNPHSCPQQVFVWIFQPPFVSFFLFPFPVGENSLDCLEIRWFRQTFYWELTWIQLFAVFLKEIEILFLLRYQYIDKNTRNENKDNHQLGVIVLMNNLILRTNKERNVWAELLEKLVSANPGLKVNQSINISCIKMFLLLRFCVVWD